MSEYQDQVPVGDHPGDANGRPIRIGRGSCKAPVRKTESTRQFRTNPLRIFCRHHECRAGLKLFRDCGDHCWHAVASTSLRYRRDRNLRSRSIYAAQMRAGGAIHIKWETAGPPAHPVRWRTI
jgi:hypothetical protein